MDTIKRIWSGDAGLAKTFWVFGFIVNNVWWLMMKFLVVPGSVIAISMLAIYAAYLVLVNVGIWRSASKYEGMKLWAILAKIAVAALPASLIVGTLAAIIIPATADKQSTHQVATTPQGASANVGERNYFDKFDGTQSVDRNQTLTASSEMYPDKISRLKRSISSGEIPLIGAIGEINLPPGSRWSSSHTASLEAGKTWWVEDDKLYIHINNETGVPLEIVEFNYSPAECSGVSTNSGEQYNFTPSPPITGSAVVVLQTLGVIKASGGCLKITGALGHNN